MKVIGLMSGTSLDGIDAALVEFDGEPGSVRWQLLGFRTIPYTGAQRLEIHAAIERGSAAAICRLHAQLGEWLAGAALCACEAAGVAPAEVDLIGSHGQTIWHLPPTATERGATLQLGCPATIAERTGVAVVSDLRARDMAAGGQGAPLVPWVDRLLFAARDCTRVLQNIGGMANLTLVPRRGDDGPGLAFDTGPGNALIDAAVELATRGADCFDRDGGWARMGRVDPALLDELLAHEYFRIDPPKSTGREVFGRALVQSVVARRTLESPQEWADLIATLTAFTVRSISDALHRWVLPLGVDEVVVTGGGARNPRIMEGLRAALSPLPIHGGERIGLDADAKEAVAFAALAWAHASGVPANVPAATGAAGPRVLGSFTPGR